MSRRANREKENNSFSLLALCDISFAPLRDYYLTSFPGLLSPANPSQILKQLL